MAMFEQKINRTLEEVHHLALKQKKLTGFCIGTTRKTNSTGLYFSPIRNTVRLIAGSVIVYNREEAQNIASQVDGKVDYILLDSEKKISLKINNDQSSEDIESTVRAVVRSSKILTYKGNDLAVDSIESLVVQILSTSSRGLSGKKATIIGAGNIGSKLALKLVERGMNVTITRRDLTKLKVIVAALNFIKTSETFTTISGTTDNLVAAKNTDLLIGLTVGSPLITAAMINAVSPGATLIDAGKGCFLPEAISLATNKKIIIHRADIRSGFEGYIGLALETERMIKSLGRKRINGVSVVSAGLLAERNEVVVDNVYDLQTVFGVADGMGDFIRGHDARQAESIQLVQQHIDGRRLQ